MSMSHQTSYDQVPYESHPFFQTHPDRLATVATLLGLKPPPVARCRVLELGCAAGGNLIPMALALPDSTFVGIDLSGREIADGQRVVAALGLTNIELKHLSILDVTKDLGRFDYLLCHGVFSWVPTPVQDKILAICRDNLAPHGIAYVSYNTLPGWHLRGLIRDMMQYHAEHFNEPMVKVRQARNLLDFLAKSVGNENTPYGLLLKSEVESIRKSRDSYLFHEHLEDVNEPIYFHQFVKRAQAAGLHYLAEVELRVMVPGNYPPEVESVLQMLSPDLIHMEQYLDFLRNRMFRQTLLCHQHLQPNYALRPDVLTALHVASPAKPVADKPNLHPTEYEQFRGPDGVTLNSREPILKAAMVHLAEVWPQAVPFRELLPAARARLQRGSTPDAGTAAQDMQVLGEGLLRCYTSAASLVELHVHPPRFAAAVSDRPVASPLARYQAAVGNQVTNLRHELVTLGDFERHVLRLLDGSRDRAALVGALATLVAQGELMVQQDGQPVVDAAAIRRHLGQALEEQLPRLARGALLVS
jgi:methyltransferase-like protein/2-polyprenyl-3-methyl-5-hydroxy-6-metoxy-1,4-benzoquinol methylase